MTRATLAQVLQPALRDGYAVAGFVCLGWEDARAFAMAAEDEGKPVILQAGPGCRAHTPLPVLGAMFRHLADSVSVPVVLHLDHGRSLDEARAAIAEGFTSVMFDGSALPLDENIRQTAAVVALAHAAGVSCEGEIGFVGYADGAASALTDPEDAARFAHETGVDAMAIAVGNVHLQQDHAAAIDMAAVAAIAAATGCMVPLVIHGGSGVPPAVRAHLARTTPICKFNLGTELRQVFGAVLRQTLQDHPQEFDRLKLLSATEAPMRDRARAILRDLG
jgi:fructose-bisphosphate aldolase, class II